MITKTQKIILSISVAAGIMATSSVHANIVVNGGFETGDFTGWTLVGNPGFRSVVSFNQHGGSYAGSFGAVGSPGGILQTSLSTSAGQSYSFDFWLRKEGGNPSSALVTWNGISVLSLSDPSAFGYTHYAYTVTATGASTAIEFDFRNDPSFFYLDDISVEAISAGAVVPEPSTYLAGALLLLPFGAHAVRHLRTRRQVS